MEVIKRTITTEEITGYKAIDGAWFKTEDQCRAYEESAKIVAYKMIKPYIVGETNAYNIYEGEGSEEDHIDIIFIKDAEVLRLLNQYRILCARDVSIIGEDEIGKTIMIGWDYEGTWSWNMGTIDDLLDKIRKNYEGSLNEEEGQG